MKNLNKVLGAVKNVDGKFSFKLVKVGFDMKQTKVCSKVFAVFMNGRLVEHIVVYVPFYKGRKIMKPTSKKMNINQNGFDVYNEKCYDNDFIYNDVKLYNAYVELINKLLVL